MDATQDTSQMISEAQAEDDLEMPDLSHRLSDGQANTIYRRAYNLSQQGHHEQAGALFALLSLYRPLEPKYARGAAICFRKMGRYEDAIRMFARTMELHPGDYAPIFPLAECLVLLGRREQALTLLKAVAGGAGEGVPAQTRERAGAMIELSQAAGQ